MARLLLVLLACVIPLGLGWAGEAPAPQADDEYADLESESVPPDLVRADTEGGGEIFHAYPDELSQQYAGANGAHRMKEALCVYNIKLKKYDSSGALGDLDGNKLPMSVPHPVITMGGADFSTTSTSHGDATTLPTVTGTISLSGNLTSGMCDITAGAQGTIDSVEVYLDHGTMPFATVPVQVTKGAGQAPRKYPYAGAFSVNLPVTLGIGPHTFTVRARDKVIGKIGSADIVVEVRARPGQEPTPTNPSPAGFTMFENPLVAEVDLGAVDIDALTKGTATLEMKVTSLLKNGPPIVVGPMRRQMKSLRGLVLAGEGLGLTTVESALRSAKAGTVDIFAATVECPSIAWLDRSVIFRRVEGSRFVTDYYTLRITGSLGGGPIDVVIKRGPNGPEVAKELNKDGDSYSSSDGSVSMDIEPTQPADGQPAGATATVTSSDLGISGEKIQVQQSPTDGNVMSSDEITGNEGAGDEEGAYDDVELYVDYPEVIAQDDTEEFSPLAIEIDGPAEIVDREDFRVQTYAGERKVIKEDGTVFISNEAGTERETLVLLRSQESPTFDGKLYEDLADLPLQSAQFLAGFGVGFAGGAADMVTGTGELIGKAFSTGGLLLLWWLPNEDGEIASDIAQERSDAAYEMTSDVITAVTGIVKNIGERRDEIIEAIITGDREKLSGIGEEYATIFEMGFDIISEATEVFVDDMSSYDQGKLFGQVMFEIASLVMPAASAGNLAKLQKAAVLERTIAKIKTVEWFAKLPAAKQAKLNQSFEKVAQFASYLRITKMCFVAGTLIATDHGFVPIELVKAGDRVLSRDPDTGSEGYRPVVETFVTRPTRLHHIFYRASHARRDRAVGAVVEDIGESDEPPGCLSELVCTAEHPFFVVNRSLFVPAQLLRPGDLLYLAGGLTAVVEGNSVEGTTRGDSFTTYNFEVADYHTYFVGKEMVWVHNAAPQACTRVFTMFANRLKHNGNKAWQSYRETRDRISRLSDSVLLRLKLFNEARSRYYKEALFGDAGPWHNVVVQHLPVGVVGSPARLGSNMEKVLGIPKPPGMASHHIVEKAANPEARAIIERAGLHIDEASNGVWMPTDLIFDEYRAAGKADWLQGVGPRHQGSHTEAYHRAVTARLTPLDGQPAAVIRDELQKIAYELVEGSFPW